MTASTAPDAILFDRDGTLIVDVPYNGDERRVVPMPTAIGAVRRAREAGCKVGVVTNQSGIARGLVSPQAVERIHERVTEIFGSFDVWRMCPHGPDDGCGCRKPAPGMVRSAAAELGVVPERVVVIGDIEADINAARAAGATGILVPTPRTLPDEVARAARVATCLDEAVAMALEGVLP
ncbi:MAG TPA: HAD family hydrolase [Microbacterium sp.]|nr:HAD family hydrolase [Microbacterium sp.]